MSTYLVAMIVCDFEHRTSDPASDADVRIWARSNAIEQTEYARGIAARILRYFEEFFQKKTQEERRQRMEELKQRNLSQQRRRAQRREQRRQRKLARRENRKATNRRSSTAGSGRKTRDLPRIDCRVRSPAHVVNLLLLIHSQKVRDVVAGRWLEECNNNKSRPRPSTSLRYFG